MASIIRADTLQNLNTSNIITQTNATTLTIGASGQNIVIPSGVTFNTASATINYPAGSITNAAINASAAIAYSKLNLSNSIVNADIASNAAIATTKLGAGAVLQVVSVTSTTPTATTSTSYVASTLVASITPTSASNKIFIIVSTGIYAESGGTYAARFTIFRGTVSGTDLGAANVGFLNNYNGSGSAIAGNCGISYLDSPNTTSSTTYTFAVRSEGNSQNAIVNTSAARGSITLLEIAG